MFKPIISVVLPIVSCRISIARSTISPGWSSSTAITCLGYYSRGLVLYDMRQYDRAIREFDHAINAKPNYAPAFNIRGLAYAAIGETRRSIQDFDQAIQLDGSFAKAFVNRGNIYQSTGNYDRALADYSRRSSSIRRMPTRSTAAA